MKIYSKTVVASLALVLSAGGGLVLAQTPAPQVNRPSSAPQVATQRGTSPGTGPRRGGVITEQPNMVRAYLSLQEAKRALEAAVPDKGGFREKALQSVDQAIKDVGAGVEYARTHSAEGSAPRPTNPRGTATTTSNSSFGGVTPSGVSPSSK
jgi:hypothetical protein